MRHPDEVTTEVLGSLRAASVLAATDPDHLPRLGFPRASSGFGDRETSSYWVLVGMARELGCTLDELRAEQSPSGQVARIEVAAAREAAYFLLGEAVRLPPQQRDVVVARARGRSWRAILRALPGRAHFSVVEDFRAGCRRLASVAHREVGLLSDRWWSR